MPLTLSPIPTTFEDAVSQLASGLDQDERDFILSNSSSASIHFGGGMATRNAWNLWGTQPGVSTELRDEFISRFKLGHADDMSALLLSALWADVRNEFFDRDGEIARYHNHWKAQGVDPVTQERLP